MANADQKQLRIWLHESTVDRLLEVKGARTWQEFFDSIAFPEGPPKREPVLRSATPHHKAPTLR